MGAQLRRINNSSPEEYTRLGRGAGGDWIKSHEKSSEVAKSGPSRAASVTVQVTKVEVTNPSCWTYEVNPNYCVNAEALGR